MFKGEVFLPGSRLLKVFAHKLQGELSEQRAVGHGTEKDKRSCGEDKKHPHKPASVASIDCTHATRVQAHTC